MDLNVNVNNEQFLKTHKKRFDFEV